jgi:hypothetical protein
MRKMKKRRNGIPGAGKARRKNGATKGIMTFKKMMGRLTYNLGISLLRSDR